MKVTTITQSGRSLHTLQWLFEFLWQLREWRRPLSFLFLSLVASCALIGCKAEKTSKTVAIGGSSTVYPLSKAIAEAYGRVNPALQFNVEFSGTGGGLKKFCAGQLDITGASRPINATEMEQCKAQHVEYIEVPVAFDSLSLVVNAKNSFVDCLKVSEIRSMWEPKAEGKISTWQQIRPSFPAQQLQLFSPGKNSGTFDYFTLAIVGTEGKSRADVTMSEDDMVIERGVEANPNAIGYFGYAYYQANKEKVKLVAIDNGHGCIAPSAQTVADATYQPLTRPLFIYVNTAVQSDVKAFARFYLSSEAALNATKFGFVPLPAAALAVQASRLDKGVKGSAFGGRGSVLGIDLNRFNGDEEDYIKNQLVQ